MAERDKVVVQDVSKQVSSGKCREVTLGELGEVNRGRSRHRPRNAPELYGGPYPFIQTSVIKSSGGRITTHTQTYSEAGLAQSRLWPAGTMVITIAANIAETAILTYPACFPDSVVGFVADKSKCDAQFVEYTFRLLRDKLQHENVGTGSVQDNINLKILGNLRFSLPPLPTQRAIAHVLGTLDDKIELNRRMNETLEEMARALFKSWFVDFDPVRAKMEGRWRRGESLPGLPADLYDLFPDRLVDSELGEIPEGWGVKDLGTVATQRRAGVKPEDINPASPYIALEHMPRRCIALAEWARADGLASGKFRFKREDILFGKLRPYFHKVGVAPLDGVCSTDIVVVSPISPQWFGFVLGHTSSKEFVDYTDATSTGTRMPRTKWEDMARYKVALPNDEISRVFSKIIRPWIGNMLWAIHESRSLAEQREALLPKLVSGEVGVMAERAMEVTN